jgi:hypothetical protein
MFQTNMENQLENEFWAEVQFLTLAYWFWEGSDGSGGHSTCKGMSLFSSSCTPPSSVREGDVRMVDVPNHGMRHSSSPSRSLAQSDAWRIWSSSIFIFTKIPT